uniref:Uncharacterized protein n=1 Tax=Syphacia muris TaxID=451379 RepID=A0A0N5AWF9_9BILA
MLRVVSEDCRQFGSDRHVSLLTSASTTEYPEAEKNQKCDDGRSSSSSSDAPAPAPAPAPATATATTPTARFRARAVDDGVH